MELEETLLVEATDPAFKADVEAWIRKTGNELVDFKEGTIQQATIKRKV